MPRAKGRSLTDFSDRSAAEEEILAAVAAGKMAEISQTRPKSRDDSNTVRAEFLRFLALGGDETAPVHEKGLWVPGAWITGMLDLSYAEIAGALVLVQCRFAETPGLYDAQIRGLFSLKGSQVRGLVADRLVCHFGVFLSDGFSSTGEVRLLGATIGGNLGCTGGTFENPAGKAISADGMKVDENVFMNKGFMAKGAVHLLGATIGGNLECTGGVFENPEGDALSAGRMKVGGSVFMGNGFKARGAIRLLGATIGGQLSCRKGSFSSENSPAINCQGMTVSGSFIFDGVTISNGTVDLTVARVANLVDDLASWPQNIILDGFVYESFAGNAPTQAKARLAWLDKQSPADSGEAKNPREFRPQPWQQLRKVLREQGHYEDSREIAIAFEDRKRECGAIGEISEPITFGKRLGRRAARGFHWLYGFLIRYGYRPARLLGILVLVWVFCTGLFYVGANNRVFGPTDLKLAENPTYPAFYPPLYALDVLLPIVQLGEQKYWAPLNPAREKIFSRRALAWVTQIVVWLETLFGWIAGLLLVATVTGLAKRHED